MIIVEEAYPSDPLTRLRRQDRAERRQHDPVSIVRSTDARPGRMLARAKRGELVRVARGAFVAPPDDQWPSWRKRKYLRIAAITAVAQRLPPGLAIGGADAALLMGVPVLALRDEIEVHGQTFPATQNQCRGALRIVREGISTRIADHRGLPVVSAVHTAVECARRLPIDHAFVVVDGFLNLLADPYPWQRPEGEAAIARIRRQMQAVIREDSGRRGNRQAALVLSLADGWAESPLESLVRRAVLMLGLPAPRLQSACHTDRATYYTDAAFEFETATGLYHVHVEADGRSKVQQMRDVWKMQEREQEIRKTGDAIIRLTWDDLREHRLRNVVELLQSVLPPEVTQNSIPDARLMTVREKRSGVHPFTMTRPSAASLGFGTFSPSLSAR